MRSFLTLALMATLSFAAIAQTIEIPRIDIPSELANGQFAEGTITRLSSAEVAEFLPWAQNSRNQLNRAINGAKTLPLRQRLPHIERAVRAVVARSESRQYQMLMRYSLNRGLLLVEELKRHMDMTQIGSQENALDLLQRSITVALSFYESDLTFQQRAQNGSNTVVIPHADFGTAFMQGLYPGVVNVLDATAQYRLLYKLVEMVNWDLSRDADAPRFAEAIVEAFEMVQDMPEQSESSDVNNLFLVRRLNSLKIIRLRSSQTAGDAQNTNEADGVPAPTGSSTTDMTTINNPTVGGYMFAHTGNMTGVCKVLGFGRYIDGSARNSTTARDHQILLLDANGLPTQTTNASAYNGVGTVVAITCVGRQQPVPFTAIRVLSPKINGTWISHATNAQGACRALGHRSGVPGHLNSTSQGAGESAVVFDNTGVPTSSQTVSAYNGVGSITELTCIR